MMALSADYEISFEAQALQRPRHLLHFASYRLIARRCAVHEGNVGVDLLIPRAVNSTVHQVYTQRLSQKAGLMRRSAYRMPNLFRGL
jgi:hypothetical protein